jgi:Fe-S-cluster-containing dehydrogenase component/DMSO reductase anchor subunit
MNFDDTIASAVAALPGSMSWDLGGRGLLVDSLLTEQGDLSAVERFAQFHEHAIEPLQGRYYRALLPVSPPGPGQQLAFEVELDRCSGCKACVAACHSLNGLDDGESWRDVGLLVGSSASLPVLHHVTSACHHCLDPACLTACPVDAFEKDPITGIVNHLDDQCFGCQYCTLACPYDAPKFHAGKGIIRKCDMCGDRIRGGEAPACVQACPHEAIRIAVVDHADIRARAGRGEFVPTAFDPSYTAPTTVYRSIATAELRSADLHRQKLEHSHPALVVMLVLTQLSVGGFLVELAARLAGSGGGIESRVLFAICLGLGYAGLAASLFHLGRPHLAYRAILGWRHSWLSREVLAFGLFSVLATALVGADVFAPAWAAGHPRLQTALLLTAVLAGMSGVASSVMVYHVVRRPFWRASSSGVKFFGTTVVLGLASALACLGVSAFGLFGGARDSAGLLLPIVAGALALLSAAKLSFEAGDRLNRHEGSSLPLRRTAWLLRGPLKGLCTLRLALGVLGGLFMPLLAILGTGSGDSAIAGAAGVLALVACIGGEAIERTLFFRAVTRPKMPGGLPS